MVVKDRGASRTSPRADRKQVDDSMVGVGLAECVVLVAEDALLRRQDSEALERSFVTQEAAANR